jgi:short-subunit dehydrogenase
MAEHTARKLAARGDSLALVGRDPARLEAIAGDLRSRGAPTVVCVTRDLTVVDDPDALFDEVAQSLRDLDAVLMFQGALGDAPELEASAAAARAVLRINFNSPAELALAAVRRLDASAHPRPALVAIGSVAGDRGRASNYVYGSAKAGLGVLMQGLHHRLTRRGSRIRAVVVKPGFVDTPMTAAFKKGALWAKPDAIAATIVAAMDRGGAIVYAPWFWRWIMLIIRLVPQPLINRTNL